MLQELDALLQAMPRGSNAADYRDAICVRNILGKTTVSTRQNLEKLTFAYLGDWIRRQQAAVDAGEAGSDARLQAAKLLQARLKLILEGEPMKLLRRTRFGGYLDEIRSRLKALEQRETKPKVIPRIFQFWKDPETFRGMVG